MRHLEEALPILLQVLKQARESCEVRNGVTVRVDLHIGVRRIPKMCPEHRRERGELDPSHENIFRPAQFEKGQWREAVSRIAANIALARVE